MVVVEINKDISGNDFFIKMFGLEDEIFSRENVKKVLSENEAETDFLFNINCDGGSVSEGLAIYDILRTSGKNIHMNIEGSCHSMAVTLLLAAPFENRTANPNVRALIHRVYGAGSGYANADELKQAAAEIEREENAILDIYQDRTGQEREVLAGLLKAENQLTANELLNYGFISKINNYNTNSLNNLKMKDLLNKLEDVTRKVLNLLPAEPVNKDFVDVDGNVLFTSEAETLEVGSDVSVESGVYTLEDGTIVTVEGMKVTAIETPAPQNSEVDNLKAENEALKAELEALKANVNTQNETIEAQNAALVEVKNTLIETKAMVQSKATVVEPVNKAPEVQKPAFDADEFKKRFENK